MNSDIIEFILFSCLMGDWGKKYPWNSVLPANDKNPPIWLVGMLFVSRSWLVEEDSVEVFHYYGFHLSSSFLMYNFKSFQGK